MPSHIVIVDCPRRPLADLREALVVARGTREGIEIVATVDDLTRRLGSDPPVDLVVVPFPEGNGGAGGAEILRAVRAAEPDLSVVAVAERGDVMLAGEAVAAGASDFFVAGDRLGERAATLLAKVRRVVTLRHRARSLLEQNRRFSELEGDRYRLVGQSPEIREVVARIHRVAAIPRPVLVVGERGTGKELVARAIHQASGRGSRPFVAVNCAAFPEALLESELFGHEKGAFTGADRTTQGKFEQAGGGTLFLDEISHMPLAFQQKILRVVEYGTFARVGGRSEIRSDARVLAATNADLPQRIREGRFLPDLFDRLAFEVVEVPPLRERRGDVAVLARHFLREFLREVPALGEKQFDAAALAVLERYPFPGNVRELKTIIERAAYRDTTAEINVEDLTLPAASEPAGGTFHERVEAFERRLVREALQQAGGNGAEAARRLGLAYHRFRYFARKLLPRQQA